MSSEDTKPFLVGGGRGVGKSALLANWARRFTEHHQEVPFDPYLSSLSLQFTFLHKGSVSLLLIPLQPSNAYVTHVGCVIGTPRGLLADLGLLFAPYLEDYDSDPRGFRVC